MSAQIYAFTAVKRTTAPTSSLKKLEAFEARYAKFIHKGMIEKSSINLLSKALNRAYWIKDEGKKQVLRELKEETREGELDNTLTLEQTEFGIAWLRARYIKKNGKPRKAASREFNGCVDELLHVLATFDEFRFIGFYWHCNGFGQEMHCTPVYRTLAEDGSYFDYSPIYFSDPIITNYNFTK